MFREYFLEDGYIQVKEVEALPTGYSTLEILEKKYDLNMLPEEGQSRDGDYNCMGFAMGTYDWLELYNFAESDQDDDDYRSIVLDDCVDEILNLEDELSIKIRQLDSSTSHIYKDEYRIGFRVGTTDFHFIRQMPDGKWYEKCGATMLQEFHGFLNELPWINMSGTEYDSDIAYFAIAA